MSNLTPSEPTVVYVNQGKFGAVLEVEGTGTALKVIHSDSKIHRDELWKEYLIGIDVSQSLNSAGDGFGCPSYYMYGSLAASSTDAVDRIAIEGDVSKTIQRILLEQSRSSLALDMIPFLDGRIGETYGQATGSHDMERVRLIRLYFGRAAGGSSRPVQHASDTDPPIDIVQYRALREGLNGAVKVPSADDVCEAMGVMLAKLHWEVGINGRDAELCLAGDGKGGVKLVIFDWNMCSRWLIRHPIEHPSTLPNDLTFGEYAENDLCSGAKRLAMLILSCESYYPRPHQTEAYSCFRRGYQIGVQEVLDKFMAGNDEPQEELLQVLSDAIRAGMESFLKAYEDGDAERVAARARRAQRTVSK